MHNREGVGGLDSKRGFSGLETDGEEMLQDLLWRGASDKGVCLECFEGIGMEERLVDSLQHMGSGSSKAVAKRLVVCT